MYLDPFRTQNRNVTETTSYLVNSIRNSFYLYDDSSFVIILRYTLSSWYRSEWESFNKDFRGFQAFN